MLRNIRKKLLFVAMAVFTIWGLNPKKVFSETIAVTNTGPEKNQGTILFYEGFENGMPSGWLQEPIIYPDGFKAYWNIRKGAGRVAGINLGDPDTAAVGQRNLTFQFQGRGHVTRIITPPINLEFAVNPVLSFYHAQVEWQPGEYDRLTIYYRKGENGSWHYLQPQYAHDTQGWVHRSILLTDHGSDKVYFAFEGLSDYGFGVCIDEFTITETGIIPRALDNVVTEQASTNFVPTRSINNPILKTTFRVTGNTGNLKLNRFTVKSQNTNNADVSAIKLFYSPHQGFSTQFLLGQATSFQNGTVVFDNLNFDLPTGYSNLWVTYDINEAATHGNFVDAFVPGDGILVNGNSFPASHQNPLGRRVIYESIYYDDFSADQGWQLTGEWEIAVPKGYGGTFGSNGSNGSKGHPGPSSAFVGSRILGTDITGLGAFPGNYEQALDTLEYVAVSPSFDCYYFKDVTLSFQRWLNIEATDKAYIHVSNDNGATWEKIWENTDFFSALSWTERTYTLPKANRKKGVKLRFALGATDYTDQYSGWNIDNLVVTGTFVTQDAGIKSWVSPQPYCGMSSDEIVRVEVKNYGAQNITSPIPVGYSLNGGLTWNMSVVNGGIPVGGTVVHTFPQRADFSVPGRYNDILVKVFWDQDQDNSNDILNHSILSTPHIVAPYTQLFIESDGLWTGYGENSTWQWAIPTGPAMQSAHSGQRAWFTNPDGVYKPQEVSWLESPCFSFAEVGHPVIEFYLRVHTPAGADGAGIEYTLDEGATWQSLNPLSEILSQNWSDNPVAELQEAFGLENGWSGNHQQWKRVSAVLGEEIAGHEKVKFRLVFAAGDFDPATYTWEGIGFDSFSLFAAPHDIGVDALVSPVSSCELGTEEQFTVSVKNFGINTLPAGTQIPAAIEVNEEGTFWQVFTLASPMAPGNTSQFTFSRKYDLRRVGPHHVKAFTALPGDTDFYHPGQYNDTLVTQVIVRGYPDPFLSDTLYVAGAMGYMLDAGAEYAAFKWFDNSTDRFFPVTNPYSDWYTATVTDIYGCTGSGTVYLLTYDVEVAEILTPENACELTSNELPVIRIKNHGPETFGPGRKFPFKAEISGNVVARDTLIVSENWLPGTEIEFEFTNGIDLQAIKTHDLKISQAIRDVNTANDFVQKNVRVYGYPNAFLPPFIATNQPQNVVLDPQAGTNSYLWHDGSTNSTFQAATWGEHWVEVTNPFGCKTLAVTTIYPEVPDIAVGQIIEPTFLCAGTQDNQLKVMLRNASFMVITAGTEIEISYQIGNEEPETESLILTEHLLPQTNREYIFSRKFTAPVTSEISIKVIAELDGDAVEANNSGEKTLEVKALPDVSLGGNRYTVNPEGIELTPGHGFASYLWHDGYNGPVYIVTSPQSRSYSVKVTDNYGCSNSDTIKFVTYNLSLHDILSPKSYCELTDNESVEIRLHNQGYHTFEPGSVISIGFALDGSNAFTEDFEIETPWNANTYRDFRFNKTLDLTSKSSFNVKAWVATPNAVPANDTHVARVELTQKPVVSLGYDIYTLYPELITLDAGNGFHSYLWHDGQQGQKYHVESFGWKLVYVTDQYGCMGSDTIFIGQHTGAENWHGEFISRVYPNPAREILNLEMENIPTPGMEITLVDMNGRVIYKEVVRAGSTFKHTWHTNNLSPGVYLVKIAATGFRKTHRITITP